MDAFRKQLKTYLFGWWIGTDGCRWGVCAWLRHRVYESFNWVEL